MSLANRIHCKLRDSCSFCSISHIQFDLFSEVIRNRTLDFLSKTLPVLKADDTLPKVTQILDEPVDVIDQNR